MAYLNRVFDVRLKAHLKAMGAVLIEGPKWCGKTTTAKQLANSVISLQDTDHREEYLATAITKPSFLLEGEVPRLIDELTTVKSIIVEQGVFLGWRCCP